MGHFYLKDSYFLQSSLLLKKELEDQQLAFFKADLNCYPPESHRIHNLDERLAYFELLTTIWLPFCYKLATSVQ